MITRKGVMIEIVGPHNLPIQVADPSKPHKERVKKAILLKIEELSKHPKWMGAVLSMNGNNSKDGEGGS